jgi:hypothetical protein
MADAKQLQTAIHAIAKIIAELKTGSGAADADAVPGCRVKRLPNRLRMKAADLAVQINPRNDAARRRGEAVRGGREIAVAQEWYWGPTPRTLSVSFLSSITAARRDRILEHLNAWSQTGCVDFQWTQQTGDVRIAFINSGEQAGYWSYLGTQIRLIPTNRPTMNLEGFDGTKSEATYRRVVRHEAGHTLGFEHEHMRPELVQRIDRQKAYDYFWETEGWSPTDVDQQVLTPLVDADLIASTPDQDSIMCYMLPGTITTDGEPIRGGADINPRDYAFAAQIYPKSGGGLESGPDVPDADNWPESEDVVR